MKKRGELTTTQIVMIIILIVSFIVILYVLYELNLGSTSNSQICYNSVVLESKSASTVGYLTCKTDYVCISGGGKCANMNPTVTVKVDVSNQTQIMKAIADQLSNCWWMFGEGQLTYGTRGLFGSSGCALCSVVEFDNTILAKNYDLSYSDFYNYLGNTLKDNTQTYLTYLYGVYNVNSLISNNPVLKYNLNNSLMNNSQYSISTGYSTGFAGGFIGKNGIIPAYYLPSNQLSSELKCSNFVTEA
jgi:uncharacterized membrane protein YciS (DUF1049 family)